VTKPNPENCSSNCAYDCAQLQYTIQHSTVLIISPLTSKYHSSDVVYQRILKNLQQQRTQQLHRYSHWQNLLQSTTWGHRLAAASLATSPVVSQRSTPSVLFSVSSDELLRWHDARSSAWKVHIIKLPTHYHSYKASYSAHSAVQFTHPPHVNTTSISSCNGYLELISNTSYVTDYANFQLLQYLTPTT